MGSPMEVDEPFYRASTPMNPQAQDTGFYNQPAVPMNPQVQTAGLYIQPPLPHSGRNNQQGGTTDSGSESGFPRTPEPHEYLEKGHPMEWYSSDCFNPYELPKYTGSDFNTFIDKFQRRIKWYEKLTEEDRVGTLYDRLDPTTQILIRYLPHLQKKADLLALIESI
ncbi:hypothetical protein HMI56_000363 [Coelomomyces lativittatus]|nr:hypothetical protein HMI56_000363 [Coelomomyces lativittatus]